MEKHSDIATRVIGGIVSAAQPVVSPDGSKVAFVVARVDIDKNTYRTQVWLADVASGATSPLTAGEQKDGNPQWSPDGTQLAFTSRRSEKEGEATVHVLTVGGPGEVRTVATMKDGAGALAWSPDGAWLAFTSRTRDERYDAEDESWQSPRKIESFFTRLDNEGWIVDRPQHVYVVRADGTAPPRNLTPGPHQHDGASWLADSSGVVTSSARHETWDRDFASDLYVVPLHGEIHALTKQTGSYSMPSVDPGGSLVAMVGFDDPSTYPQNAHIAVVPVEGGSHRWLTTALDRTFETTAGPVRPIWLDATTIAGTVEDRGATHLISVSVDSGEITWLTSGAISVRSADATAGTIAYCASAADRPSELFVLRDGESRRLTSLSDGYVADVQPVTWEHFTVDTSDGALTGENGIDAWIVRPAGFVDGERYPVLLNVHGGPHTQYGETYFDEFQMQAAAGFVVLACNPRGGSGREQAWGQAIRGPKHPVAPGTGWGAVDVDDVIAVLDAALARYPFCDPDRVGMLGGSYGGYMATMLAGRHGERFRALCSERAVNNMLSEEWSSDIGTIFRVEHGPSILDDPDEYMRMSPITHARDIHVPLLIIHSENDLRCPISQAEQLFVTLRLLGRDVTFYRFPAEGHELSRSGSPVHRRQRAEIILDYFAEKCAAR